MSELDVRIRRADSLDDIQACLELQRTVWGFVETDDMVAPPLLILGNRYGGCVLVSEAPGGEIVGFSYAFLALDSEPDGGLFWWSHMTAVLTPYRGRSIGFGLKLAQRDAAIEAGIKLIRWTFDPLRAMNASFNIRKLGALSRIYEKNIYGPSSSPLHHGVATDRLVAEWRIDTDRVRDRLSGEAAVILRDFDGIVRINSEGGLRPDPPVLGREDSTLTLEIPPVLDSGSGRDLVRAWQQVLGQAFTHYLGRGYVVTDFVRLGAPRPRAFYVIEKSEVPVTRDP
jgi:predicted GNAT superfamily acetyltransferase